MKKERILLSIMFSSIFGVFTAQHTCRLNYAKDMRIKSVANNYYQDFDMDETGKLSKMKPEKREKAVEEFNEKILTGKIKPASYPLSTTISNVYADENSQTIEMSYDMNKQTVSNFYRCANDTMFISRMNGILFHKNQQGDTSGVSIYGVEKIPIDLKVGDVLPMFNDFTWYFPVGYEANGTISVFAGFQRVSGVAHGAFVDSKSGNAENGYYRYEKSIPTFMDKEVPGYMQMQVQNLTIYNAYSAVTEEIEVEIDGKTYQALVIESENWSKATTDFQFFSQYQEAIDRFNSGKAYLDKKYTKKFEKFGLVNEQGYAPSYLTRYYVPEFGIVKTISYDPFGRIMAIIDFVGLAKD